jgi:hypothetical protein
MSLQTISSIVLPQGLDMVLIVCNNERMILGEALNRRSNLQKRITQLQERLRANVLVQEGGEPAESADELLAELGSLCDELERLIAQINHTNASTKLSSGETVTEGLRGAMSWRCDGAPYAPQYVQRPTTASHATAARRSAWCAKSASARARVFSTPWPSSSASSTPTAGAQLDDTDDRVRGRRYSRRASVKADPAKRVAPRD